jgi:uncharacterized protein (DUF4415 family)
MSKTNKTKLRQKDDYDIDYSDISETTEDFWKDADVFMPAHKVHLSLRLDENVVSYFKKQGPGYQSRINAVLKAYVITHLKRVRRA